MADARPFSKLHQINTFARALVFNFKAGLGLVVFIPVDAGMLSTLTDFPTRETAVQFFFWLALLLGGAIVVWTRAPRARHAARQAQLGLETPADPRDVSELLLCEASMVLGLFLMLLSQVKGEPPVSREWDLGFLGGGVALGCLGLYRLYRYTHPAPEQP